MQAFNVGIDWFTEIFFFYGILLGVCYWEFNKYVEAQKKLKIRIDNLEENGEEILESLKRIRDNQKAALVELAGFAEDIKRIPKAAAQAEAKV